MNTKSIRQGDFMAAKTSVPLAVKRCHDLLLWIIPQIDQFPRARRFTIGERIETSLLDVLRLLLQAAYQSKNRLRALQKVK
jgi:hypothetical protein